jgi:hypothetical protein
MGTYHLNIFIPYESKPLHHEDQLTRAFLILIRSIKLVEAVFLDLVANAMETEGIETRPATLSQQIGGLDSVETQVWSGTKARLSTESGRLVSIIITDLKLDMKHRIERNERTAVYDGFLKFRPDWVFVVENKPSHANVWVEQLSSAFNENYEIEPKPIVLTWSDIISRLSLLVSNSLVQDAARVLLEDFLAYVAEFFPELNPFDKFRLCKGNVTLLKRRCVTIMEEAALGMVEYHRGWHYSIRLDNKRGVKEVALYPESESTGAWAVLLDIFPGDTLSQARSFYSSVNVSKVTSLLDQEWRIWPNFHVAYRSTNIHWAETKIYVSQYINYWQKQVKQNALNQIPRADWQGYFGLLLQDGIISSNDMSTINGYHQNTRYPSLNICPGLSFRFKWNSDMAMAIDDRNCSSFANELKSKVDTVLQCW